LAAWRDIEAMIRNVPRRHLIPDEALIELAKIRPSSLSELNDSHILRGRERKYAQDIATAIKRGMDKPHQECPEIGKSSSNRNLLKRKIQRIKQHIEKNSLTHNIDPQLVGSRAEFEKLANPQIKKLPDENRLLTGWRRDFIGEAELDALMR
jgi:ribonuclease D